MRRRGQRQEGRDLGFERPEGVEPSPELQGAPGLPAPEQDEAEQALGLLAPAALDTLRSALERLLGRAESAAVEADQPVYERGDTASLAAKGRARSAERVGAPAEQEEGVGIAGEDLGLLARVRRQAREERGSALPVIALVKQQGGPKAELVVTGPVAGRREGRLLRLLLAPELLERKDEHPAAVGGSQAGGELAKQGDGLVEPAPLEHRGRPGQLRLELEVAVALAFGHGAPGGRARWFGLDLPRNWSGMQVAGATRKEPAGKREAGAPREARPLAKRKPRGR